MSEPPPQRRITDLLERIRNEEAGASDELLPFVYDEMRRIARAVFHSASPSRTLEPTAVLHEAWLKLVGNLGEVRDRRHYFAVAARAMRQVLKDHAKGLARQKRGGGVRNITLHDAPDQGPRVYEIVDVENALSELAALNERHARIVELRFLGTLTVPETAEELGVSESTVAADWAIARAWLRRRLSE